MCFKMAHMYIHCFAFRWKPEAKREEMERAVHEIQNLQGQIPGLLETCVGRNDSPRGQGYTFGGVMKFSDKTSFEAYGSHPAHQKLLVWLMPLIEPLELDFEA
ncbi:Dabb family protein [Alloacidobacterium sp.]|uniref:Dabb family protein n=1 Tax=Alloacidobacterium sp. TaxID=2951999 RepID=UPI002D65247F|nr:Dabb family protein [Alloacidobacterium sp.]HYK35122.1 Dabb family protein [Alloacidobacterium sp.]